MVSVNTGARPTKAITVFGHVCGDYTVPVRKLSQREAAASKESVLGLNGFRRESLWTPADLKREHGLTFQDVIEQQGWDLAKLPFSKGGPAASAALAAFQLANPNTTVVSFKGAIGDDPVGQRVMDYFRTYNMDPSCLMKIQGVPTSYSLVIPEHVEGEGDKRSFLHDPGANAALTFDGIPENDLKLPKADINVVMAGGTFLMPAFHPAGVLKLFARMKAQGAITILNTVHDPSGQWDLGLNAATLIDYLIMDMGEARGISHIDSEDVKPIMSWFVEAGFRNVIITDGVNGSYGNFSVPEASKREEFFVPASRFIRAFTQKHYGLGAGDCFAGAAAVAIAEQMEPGFAMMFASSAGGVSVLHKPGEIGYPVPQGGHRWVVNGVFDQMLQEGGALASFSGTDGFSPGGRRHNFQYEIYMLCQGSKKYPD